MRALIIIFIAVLITSCSMKPIMIGKNHMLTPGNGYVIYDTARHNQLLLTLKAGDTCSKCKTVHKK